MMDRLAELRRQRSLISEHLAWLDREIDQIEQETTRSAALSPSPSEAPAPLITPTEAIAGTLSPVRTEPVLTAPGPAVGSAAGVALPDPEILLEEFRAPPSAVKRDVRQGCLLYFVGALVLLGIGVAILYFTIGSR